MSETVQTITVPLELLLFKGLTPAAKFLWITIHMDAVNGRKRSHAPTQLARRTGLARSTVYAGLDRAKKLGWLVSYRDSATGKKRWRAVRPTSVSGVETWSTHGLRHLSVEIPVDLIKVRGTVRPQALICFGILQITAGFRRWAGQFKWAEFSRLAGLHVKTVKRAVRCLAEAGWIRIVQKNRLAPIRFRLQHADEARKFEVQRRLERAEFKGEALMREILSVAVDSQDCVDNARPAFLVNPATGERLEFDRFYPLDRVAFEFNGRQHYEVTEWYSKEEVAAQRKRDAIKQLICREKKIELVVVRAEDLSFNTILEKIGDLLPLRNLQGYERTIKFLEEACARHRRAVLSA